MSNLDEKLALRIEELFTRKEDIKVEIEKVKLKYTKLRNTPKYNFSDDAKPIIAMIGYLKVHNSINQKQVKVFKKLHKRDLATEIQFLNQDYKFAKMALQDGDEMTIQKIKTNYRIQRAKIRGEKTDPKVLLEFEQYYEEFAKNKQKELFEAREIGLAKIEADYKEKKEKIIQKHQAILDNNLSTIHMISLDDRVKGLEEENVKLLSLKNKMKEEKLQIKDELDSIKSELGVLKEKSKVEVLEINSELKEIKSTLDKEDKVVYSKYAKKFRQEQRSRILKKIDKVETKIFSKVNPAYIYIIPAIFSALVFTIFPAIFMIVASFFKLDLASLERSQFVGFNNFINIITRDIEFQKGFYNTLIYAFVTVVVLGAVTVLMAAWLSGKTKIHGMVQTMVFTPHIASLVAISILWIAMLNPSGIVNQVLAIFGIEGPGWLIDERTSLFSVSIVTVWKDIGYYVLIIIAGLQSIPPYVYEAAKLDKAGKFNTFTQITIPLLAPTLSFMFVNKFISSFKVFAPIEIMTNGGPMGSSMVLSYWIYKVGRIGYNYGNAMAGAIILTLIILVFTTANYKLLNKKVEY